MPRPNVNFFCELGPLALTELFESPGLIDTLETQQYGVALAMLDYSPQRSALVRRLNAHGIPVVAWLLLPIEEGYWFNLHNYPQSSVAYQSFREWALREDLHFTAVGLDIEPSLAEMHAARRQGGTLSIFNRAFLAQSNALYPAARDAYLDLVATIRHDGYEVHTYQYPFIVDDRRAGTTLIQRMLDIVDVPADEEVLMLYSSNFFRGLFRSDLGGAFVRSYGQHADSIGIGVTGGGVILDPITGIQSPRMTLKAFRRDLRIAAQYTDLVHIFSLEGCVDRGWMDEVAALDWDKPFRITRRQRVQMATFRGLIGFVLWCSRYGWTALGWLGWLVASSMFISRRIQRWRTLRRVRKEY
ncbi:MAG TPA: hypothetical protein VGD69_28185 [Herpetosiphonaceae bacterium]